MNITSGQDLSLSADCSAASSLPSSALSLTELMPIIIANIPLINKTKGTKAAKAFRNNNHQLANPNIPKITAAIPPKIIHILLSPFQNKFKNLQYQVKI